jgi:membrane protease YdiL (CAAX protease family)
VFFLLLVLVAPFASLLAVNQLGLTLGFTSIWQASLFLLIAPFIEEWALRAGLQAWIEREWGKPHVANFLVSLLFVGLHWQGQGVQVFLWFIPSFALGELWRRNRSLSQCVVVHIWFNCTLWWVSH